MAITTITPVSLTSYNAFVAEAAATDFAAIDATLGAKVKLDKPDEKLLICVKHTAGASSALLSITTEPATCATGNIYYKAADSLIYTATGTNTWGVEGAAPSATLIYSFNSKFYMAVTADEVTSMVEVFPKIIIKAGSYLQKAFGDTELAITATVSAMAVKLP